MVANSEAQRHQQVKSLRVQGWETRRSNSGECGEELRVDIDDIVLNLTYLMYVTAPMIRDELRLRAFLMVASVGFAIWATMIDSPWTLFWNLVFIVLSAWNVARILRERRPLELLPDEERIRARLFPEMTTRQFQIFWDMGEDYDAAGEALAERGKPLDHFWILRSGDVEVVTDSGIVQMEPVSTIGGMSYVMGGNEPAAATVQAGRASLRRWRKSDLRSLGVTAPELNAPFLSGVGRGLVSKIRT